MKFFLSFLFFVPLILSLTITPTYGVEKNDLNKYLQAEFVCDSALGQPKRISTLYVNDNYCDCLDGSDEPGTSACSNMKFYCQNNDHIGEYIPSSRVNDGICDCCDGSDEYDSSIKCENTCKQMHTIWEADHAEETQRTQKGQVLLEQWSKQGKETYKTKVARYELIPTEIESLEDKKRSLSEEYEIKKQEISKNSESSSEDYDSFSATYGLNDLKESELHSLFISVLIDMHKKIDEKEVYEHIKQEIMKINKEKGIETDIPEITPESLDVFSHVQIEDNQELKDIQSQIDELSREKEEKEKELKSIEDYKNQSHGYFYEMDILRGKCYSVKANKYFTLGNQDPQNHIYKQMSFTGGERCWNGPERSIIVTLECGEEVSLHSVSEPSTCVYNAILVTPTACPPTETMNNTL
ncbi:hypothetical protein WA158_003214 [Blastocystis sp. Blastoise]